MPTQFSRVPLVTRRRMKPFVAAELGTHHEVQTHRVLYFRAEIVFSSVLFAFAKINQPPIFNEKKISNIPHVMMPCLKYA